MADVTTAIRDAARQFGAKVFYSRYIPSDEVIVLGRGDEPDMPLPADWATLSEDERKLRRARWAIAHGASLVLHDPQV